MNHAAAVAAWGLPTAHLLPGMPLDDDAFNNTLSGCIQHRTLGMLVAAARDGAFAITPEQRERVESDAQSWLAHAVRVERLVERIGETLSDREITCIVLKGVALAHTTYPDPAWRVFGDVDLLVHSQHFTETANVVAHTFDGVRAQPELRPGFDDRFGREILVWVDPIEVDLHRTFVDGALGLTIELADLFSEPEPFAIGGHQFLALSPATRLLHAAYASVLSDWPPRLVAQRDFAQIALHTAPDLDTVLTLARRWHGLSVLAAAVHASWSALRITERPPIVEWANQYRASRLDQILLSSYRGPARGYTSQAATLLVLPGLRNRAAYLRAIAMPSGEYREARHLGRFGLLGQGAKKATRG